MRQCPRASDDWNIWSQAVFSTAFEWRVADLPFFFMRGGKNLKKFGEKYFLGSKIIYYWRLIDFKCILMASGVILKHLEADKITWGHILKKNLSKKNLGKCWRPFRWLRGASALILTGVENTARNEEINEFLKITKFYSLHFPIQCNLTSYLSKNGGNFETSTVWGRGSLWWPSCCQGAQN
jgi:hypothetical protein